MTIGERIDSHTAKRLAALRAALEAGAIEQIRGAALRARLAAHSAAVAAPAVSVALFIEPLADVK